MRCLTKPKLPTSPPGIILGGLFLCLQVCPVFAQELSPYFYDQQWLKLGYYTTGKGQYSSEIITDQFFLSEAGKSSPGKELIATVEAMRLPFSKENPNDHAICKFPARYLWLVQKGLIDNNKNIFEVCANFKKWVKPEGLQSASIVFVTGYLGNPASSFGHALLKINNTENYLSRDLLDYAVNYGAIVPDGENGMIYALFGLFGGYEAGFTARDVYEESHIYLERELRDMWEYPLNLTRPQLEFLVARIWELLGNKYQYFFLDKNCSYRMLELLELVLDEDLEKDKGYWNIPSSLFFSLSENTNVIGEARLIPSSQRALLNRYNLLNDRQREVLLNIIREAPSDYAALPEKERIEVADTVVRYYKYKKVDDADKEGLYEEKKKFWLMQRLEEPPAKSVEVDSHEGRFPPTFGHKPSLLRIETRDIDGVDPELLLGISGSYHDRLSLQDGALEDNEFIAIDISVSVEEDSIKLDQFTFASITKFLNSKNAMFDTRGISWGAELGYARENEVRQFNGLYMSGGIGKSRYVKSSLAFIFINATVSEKAIYEDDLGLELSTGLFFDICEKCSSLLKVDAPLKDSDIVEARIHFNNRYLFDKDMEGRINFIIEDDSILSTNLSLNFYW